MKMSTPLVAGAMMLALAGCGGSDTVTEAESEATESSSAPAATSEPDPEGLTEEQLVAYFEQVLSGTAERQGEAEALTAPGTAAARYLAYQTGRSASAVDSGTMSPPSDVTPADGGVEVCTEGTDCFEVTDVKTQAGRVSNFSIDGTPFADRVVGGSKPQQVADGVSVQLVGALKSVTTGSLFVTVTISSGDTGLDLASTAYTTSYLEAAGRQIQAAEAQVGNTLQPGASATILLSFPGADLGGQLVLDIVNDQGYSDGAPVIIGVERP